MDPKFANLVESLHGSFDSLVAMKPCTPKSMPKVMPERGIYLLSEGSAHLYVGRTNDLRDRLQNHCRRSGTHEKAAFAFRIAKKQAGIERASYRPIGSRGALQDDAEFALKFATARARVGQMDLRYVQENDPTRQALLEIYVATVLETPYNDFDNH